MADPEPEPVTVNKLDSVLSGIKTALDTLKTAGTVRMVKNGLVDPQTEALKPCIGMLPSDLHREGDTWIGMVLLLILGPATSSTLPDAVVNSLIAGVETAIADSLPTDGTLQAVVDLPRIDYWHDASKKDLPLVGAWMYLRFRIDGRLTTTA